MTDHKMRFTFEHDQVNASLECEAPPDAPCRWTSDCGCETISGPEKDAEGWFHVAYNLDFRIHGPDDETNLEEVVHRHDRPTGSECGMQAWINADSPLECGPGGRVALVTLPVRLTWTGDFYQWEPEADEVLGGREVQG